ncbi:MAG TPA: acetylornithine transaminase [Actinomycetales bacterium]|nr:acetylornithine transaminase [Actinomycetales bacterium]
MSSDALDHAQAQEALGLDQGSNAAWTQRYRAALMNTFGTPQRVLVRGEGVYVFDADGKRYLDLLAGIAVNTLGHAHPTLTAALTAQLGTLGHVSNFFATGPQIALAEKLLQIAEADADARVFFTNSGTEAMEAAFKIARRTGRPRILALEGAFHGRTMGALALTHKADYKEPFEPLPGGVEHLPFGDLDALEAAIADDVAALVLEPIQGEAGVRPLPAGYLQKARELTSRHGALLILDEVQTGVGRTGTWFAHQHDYFDGVQPDVMALAKGLGGGFPMGAIIAYGGAAEYLQPGQHGTTFGGNPVGAAAGLATLHVIERDDLLERARTVGLMLRTEISALKHPAIFAVRGEGQLSAIELRDASAARVAQAALEAGFIVNPVAPNAIRLAPALILQERDARTFVSALPEILDQVERGSKQ